MGSPSTNDSSARPQTKKKNPSLFIKKMEFCSESGEQKREKNRTNPVFASKKKSPKILPYYGIKPNEDENGQ